MYTLCIYVCVYVYIYIYMYIVTHIYIYIYRERERGLVVAVQPELLAAQLLEEAHVVQEASFEPGTFGKINVG